MGTILNLTNPEIYISLTNPYKNVKKILSYEDVIIADSIYYNIDKKFRFSFNNINFSNWIQLTNENLQYIKIDYKSDFWIEYHYKLINIQSNESVEFKSVYLEILNESDIVENPICSFNTNTSCCTTQSVINNTCTTNLYNPYDYGNAVNLYKDLSTAVNNMFGIDIDYYKTNPNLTSRDVILGEYSIHNVEAKKCFKVLVPDNTMPSREIMFNPTYGMGLSDLFEIHIVKSEFERLFGIGERPRTEDYIYMPLMKRIYDVNSCVLADENAFQKSTYYKVNLREHDEKVTRFDDENLTGDLKEQYDTFDEVFGSEVEDERERIRKPVQYNTLTKTSENADIIRSFIDKRVIINEHNLINQNTYQVVSDFYYDFAAISGQENVIKYANSIIPNEFAFTFLINAKELPRFYITNFQINSIQPATNYEYRENSCLIETLNPHNLKDGDVISIKQSTNYNGINYVLNVIDSNRFIIATDFVSDLGGNINKVYDKQTIIENSNISIYYTESNILIRINNNIHVFDTTLLVDKWLGFIINYSNKFNQLALYVYDNYIKRFEKTILVNSNEFINNDLYIVSGKYKLTNVRLFKVCIEDEQQISILSQNIVLDNHLALIIDNATPQFRLPKHYNK